MLDPEKWKPQTRNRIALEQFDVLVTNPPFGTKIKVQVPDTLQQYSLAHSPIGDENSESLLGGGQDPAILFVERAWQLLKDPRKDQKGGRMAIVLPKQILSGHDPAMVQIRKWILRKFRILGVVDLPSEAFQPYTGTITSVLFAEKIDERTPLTDYRIFMAVANAVGHDRRGNPLFKRRDDGTIDYQDSGLPIILDDLPKIQKAYEQFTSLSNFKSTDPSIFEIQYSDVMDQSGNRLDAWFYDPTKNDVVKTIRDIGNNNNEEIEVKSIGEMIASPADVFYPGRHKRNYVAQSDEAVPFLSGTNILQIRPFDVKWQPRNYAPVQECLIKKDWILVTRSGSTGRVIFVRDSLAGFSVENGVAVSEHVIRIIPDPKIVDPGYLFAFLSSETGRILLAQGIYASVVKHITPSHIKSIPVLLPSREEQKEIGDTVRKAEDKRTELNLTIQNIQDKISKML